MRSGIVGVWTEPGAAGPPGPGRFGAYFATLPYEDVWDRPRRLGADSDVVVRFDQSGIDPLAEGHGLVLSTCWPFDAVTPGPLRYLVPAEMIEDAQEL